MKRTRREQQPSRIAAPAPAPGELDHLQAFANTVNHDADAFASPKQLADWLAQRGLLAAGKKLTKADLGRALDVRDGLRALVAANHGTEPDEDVMTRLDRAARGARPQVRFYGDGASRFESGELTEALGRLIVLVVMARESGTWDRFKMCADSECSAVFFDHSNKRTTKWCTRRCGDRMRSRRYRRGKKYRSRSRVNWRP